MLRWIGGALVGFSALGLAMTIHAIVYLLLDHPYEYELPLLVYSGIFSICGAAAGVLLARRWPVARGPLFWIGLLGVCLTAPLLVTQIVLSAIHSFQSGNAALFVPLVFLGHRGGDRWWPPREVLFLNTLMHSQPLAESLFWSGKPLSAPFYWLNVIASSPLLWIYFPFALCLWSVCGRRGARIDKAFACGALVLAALLTTSVFETAQFYFAIQTVEPGPGEVYDYLYIPKASWFAFYAIAILLLIALAVLLLRRKSGDQRPQ